MADVCGVVAAGRRWHASLNGSYLRQSSQKSCSRCRAVRAFAPLCANAIQNRDPPGAVSATGEFDQALVGEAPEVPLQRPPRASRKLFGLGSRQSVSGEEGVKDFSLFFAQPNFEGIRCPPRLRERDDEVVGDLGEERYDKSCCSHFIDHLVEAGSPGLDESALVEHASDLWIPRLRAVGLV